MDTGQHKEDLLRRLKSVEGHVRGIEQMVEKDTYCIDLIHQVKAVQRALDKVSEEILAHHLQTCVTTAIRSDDVADRERVLTELRQVFAATNKN